MSFGRIRSHDVVPRNQYCVPVIIAGVISRPKDATAQACPHQCSCFMGTGLLAPRAQCLAQLFRLWAEVVDLDTYRPAYSVGIETDYIICVSTTNGTFESFR